MDNKLNPLQMVAKEMAQHSDLDQEMIEESLVGLLAHLQSRAVKEINLDPNTESAGLAAVQYRVICEVIAVFGTQLIAFEDMDSGLTDGETN